jgi:histidine ammonia-lyase
MNISEVVLDGHSLTLPEVGAVAANQFRAVVLAAGAQAAIRRSAAGLMQLAGGREPAYGINTGLGIFADKPIPPKAAAGLSRSLILSHAVGLGEPFAPEITRAAMLIRANSLAIGLSGVRPELVETLLAMLNRDVVPIVPGQGSLGSSGDLAPLAHLALVMTRAETGDADQSSGMAWHHGEAMSGEHAMRLAGIERLVLGPKEGLALTNGATFCAAMLSLACIRARVLLAAAEGAAALSHEALLAAPQALDAALHQARQHPGQIESANHLRQLLAGSSLIGSGSQVQDAYSLRCTPQILGPAWEILDFVEQVARREINAATDNPLLINGRALSGGNFHGAPLGLAADYLKLAMCQAGALSERRLFRLVSPHTNRDLTPMLIADSSQAGLQTGMMILQYTAASLTLENQALAGPDSIRSLPTSADQEDLNANATTAGRNLLRLLENLALIIAIEFIAASQALDLRLNQMPGAKLGEGSARLHASVRRQIPFLESDAPLAGAVESLAARLVAGELS